MNGSELLLLLLGGILGGSIGWAAKCWYQCFNHDRLRPTMTRIIYSADNLTPEEKAEFDRQMRRGMDDLYKAMKHLHKVSEEIMFKEAQACAQNQRK